MDVPKVLIEDLAKDLGVSSAVAESLVKWVIDYLNRPCCWSVGFVRLVIDLARDGKMRDVLRELGIAVAGYKVSEEGLVKLRKVLDENLGNIHTDHVIPKQKRFISITGKAIF